MVKAKLRVAVEDPLVAAQHGLSPENVWTSEESFFLDGPVTRRVAVVDRNPQTGQMEPPVRWVPESLTYSVPDDMSERESIAVSVFGIVLETLELFEREDVLGHKVAWAFDTPQLLVVPRAGTWANAFYDRYSRSLQFFSFEGPGRTRIHTALSRDIVAHETGHAIFDGLVPALYDALTPESLALHEAIGDLTSIVMALQSPTVRQWLLRRGLAHLEGSTPVSQLANEFGWGQRLNRPLRDANNTLTMSDVSREPHDLCQVLTGAFWAAMVQLHNSALERARQSGEDSDEEPTGKALGISARRIARILFRALDYLPAAEATFADYARAVLRADTVAYPADETGYRETLKKEFIRRGIVTQASELESTPEQERLRIDLNDVVESDWAAYDFAEKARRLLGIPPRVPFRLLPRREVQRRYYAGAAQHFSRREVVFQVTWEAREENQGIAGVPSTRAVFRGATLVLGGEADSRGRYPVLSYLASDGAPQHVQGRNASVGHLVERGQLDLGDRWRSVDARPLSQKVFGRVANKTLRLRGTARLLHLAGLDT